MGQLYAELYDPEVGLSFYVKGKNKTRRIFMLINNCFLHLVAA